MRLSIAIMVALVGGLLVATGPFGGSVPDADQDGVPDVYDNCTVVPNGPLAGTDACDGQEDGDLDGFGNPCDFDPNNDSAYGLDDLGETLDNAVLVTTNPRYDFNCDGAVGIDDLGAMLDNSGILPLPGPSGLPCAGTIPCVAE